MPKLAAVVDRIKSSDPSKFLQLPPPCSGETPLSIPESKLLSGSSPLTLSFAASHTSNPFKQFHQNLSKDSF